MFDFETLAQSVISGDVKKAEELTKKAVEEGVPPLDVINKGLIAGMEVVGQRFKKGDMFVPEVLIAARAMNSGLDVPPFWVMLSNTREIANLLCRLAI